MSGGRGKPPQFINGKNRGKIGNGSSEDKNMEENFVKKSRKAF